MRADLASYTVNSGYDYTTSPYHKMHESLPSDEESLPKQMLDKALMEDRHQAFSSENDEVMGST